ncbi:MAG TPA: hypothetical protein VF481_11295 [Novosphingobium sp.]
MIRMTFALATASLLLPSTPAQANSLISAGEHPGVAKSSIATSSTGEWNRLSRTDGANVEVWTRDGDNLNKVSFFGGIAAGTPLYKERDRKNMPLPRVSPNMLLPDIPVLFEATYRSQYKVNQMTIDSQDVAMIGGKQAIRFTYSYVRGEDEVQRKGEAVGAIVKGKLFMVNYEAPAIYFFDKDLTEFRHIVETLKF